MRTMSLDADKALVAEMRLAAQVWDSDPHSDSDPVSIWSASLKTDKSVSSGHVDAGFIIYLTPGVTCAKATPGCREACFGSSVNGSNSFSFKAVIRAAARRTRLLWDDRRKFHDLACEQFAKALGKIQPGSMVSVRLNGTSDVQHDPSFRRDLQNVAAHYGISVTFYEYTKHWGKLLNDYGHGPMRDGVHYTLSASEYTPRADMEYALSRGINVAVPIYWPRNKPLPATYLGLPAIDGDASDYRPLDPQGRIVLLRHKNRRKLQSEFIRQHQP